MNFNIPWVAIAIGILLLFVAIFAIFLMRSYRLTTPEKAFVRTGSGNAKVVKNGGAFVIGLIHNMTPVNMQSNPIIVRRTGEDALITQDSMRVDMMGTFVIRVGDSDENIQLAAQTLGTKTFDAAELTKLIEGKVVDAARSVAARMTMEDLHSNRKDFVQEIQGQLSGDLAANGLILETVSLTSLDQTNYANLDPNNAFNARALTTLAEITSSNAEKRATRESAANILVAEQQNKAKREKLRYEQELATEEAQQATVIAEANAQKEGAAARAAENVRKETEMAAQERQIAIAQKSREESVAMAEANEAKALAIASAEKVKTAGEVAVAERAKRIAVLKAEEEAESNATEIRVRAKAEREAAEDRAASLLENARAEAESITIRAEAEEKAGLAKARARSAMVEAENTISPAVLANTLNIKRAEILPEVVREMMKPAEKIDGIRIFHGAPSMGGAAGAGTVAGTSGNLQDAILGVALQKPAMDAIGKMLAVDLTGGIAGVLGDNLSISEVATEAPASKRDQEDLFGE